MRPVCGPRNINQKGLGSTLNATGEMDEQKVSSLRDWQRIG